MMVLEGERSRFDAAPRRWVVLTTEFLGVDQGGAPGAPDRNCDPGHLLFGLLGRYFFQVEPVQQGAVGEPVVLASVSKGAGAGHHGGGKRAVSRLAAGVGVRLRLYRGEPADEDA